MTQAKRFRRHYHHVYNWKTNANGHLNFAISDAPMQPYAAKICYYC